MKRLLLLLFTAAAAQSAPAVAQNTNESQMDPPTNTQSRKSDWEREQELRNPNDAAPNMPAWPKNDGLIEFWVTNSSAFRFYVDAASLSVGADNVVRYTLIARSPSGVANVTYEGIRCETGTYRIYAYGQDGRWAANNASEWRLIEPKAISRWHNELKVRYFCPTRGTILNAAEGVDALRRGGHPGVAARPGY